MWSLQKVLFFFAITGLAMSAYGGESTADHSSVTVPIDFLGIHVNNAAPAKSIQSLQTPMPDLGQRAVRLLNAHTDWRSLNPSPGVFEWSTLDYRIQQDEMRGYKTMLNLGGPPDWVLDIWLRSSRPNREEIFYKAWTDYLAQVSHRYGNRIAFYELWNEPDVGGFGGSLPQMLRLVELAFPILRREAPRSLILSPAFSMPSENPNYYSKWPVNLRSFISAGGGRFVDVVAIHAYPGDGRAPETLISRLQTVRHLVDDAGLSSKPIIDSESGARGWTDAEGKLRNIPPRFGEPLPIAPVDLQSAYVSRTLLVIAASGIVQQSYYFTFDNGDNRNGGRSVMAIIMTDAGQGAELHRPAQAYRYLASLLPGAHLHPIVRTEGHWELELVTSGGQQGKVYWCDDYRRDRIRLPPDVDIFDVVGEHLFFPSGEAVIGASPIFVFKR